jgi:hypothetical protein
MDDLLKQMARGLARQITDEVMENVRRELLRMNKHGFDFCYSERKAAAKLGVDAKTLYRKRAAGEIDYSRSPSGKPVYLPRHIIEYLTRHEIRQSGKPASKSSNPADFPQLKLAG